MGNSDTGTAWRSSHSPRAARAAGRPGSVFIFASLPGAVLVKRPKKLHRPWWTWPLAAHRAPDSVPVLNPALVSLRPKLAWESSKNVPLHTAGHAVFCGRKTRRRALRRAICQAAPDDGALARQVHPGGTPTQLPVPRRTHRPLPFSIRSSRC